MKSLSSMAPPPIAPLSIVLAFVVQLSLLPGCSPAPPGAAVAPAETAVAPPPRHDIERLMAFDEIAGPDFSPDGELLLFTSKRSGVANLYVMPVAGGAAEALTDSDETVLAIGWFPDGERVLYASDRGGDELYRLFVREPDGATRDLTPGERLRARFVAWAPDGASFFATTNERDPRHSDLYEYSTADYTRRRLFTNDDAYQVHAVSADRRLVALSRIHDNAHTDCFVYEVGSRRLRRLNAQGRRIACVPQEFSRDGRHLFLTSDEDREFARLERLDLASGERTTVLSLDWDVTGARLSSDGGRLAAFVNHDARTVVHLFDAATLERQRVLDAAPATVADFAMSSAGAIATVESAGDMPGDLRLYPAGAGAPARLVDSLPPGIAAGDLVQGRVVRFHSHDGVIVPGILYVPRGIGEGETRPAAVWVHGGPGGESRIGFKPMVQYLVNHGYVVYEINNRGSSGSGKTFYHLDDGRHGEADLDDVVASRQMLIDTGLVDPHRIAVMGGSYGGFMALAALAFRPDVFTAGVNVYGISNWTRLLANTPAWWEDLRRLLKSEMGDWEADPKRFEAISPAFHAGTIRRPLLVLQGANDPRVLPVESEDIVERVRANGVPVEYLVFPDEGHGFRRKANQVVAYRTIREFLDRHVRDAAPPAAAQPDTTGGETAERP
ncbi:S9 family peptidase [Luteimonas sp. SJ-92]|uniref:S9 family peptidase n=1 Tax=Luteimonas salinisoli TaxID=2752307 RepID=A0A853JGV1_9GAMM|nr:S9 family peptidase [Luteimonas salinisoli]NZA28616.1 S9 family peptidase [Luteimonas salinisoli]